MLKEGVSRIYCFCLPSTRILPVCLSEVMAKRGMVTMSTLLGRMSPRANWNVLILHIDYYILTLMISLSRLPLSSKIYICVCTYVCMLRYVQVHLCWQVYIHVYVCVYVFMSMFTHMWRSEDNLGRHSSGTIYFFIWNYNCIIFPFSYPPFNPLCLLLYSWPLFL